MSGLTKTQLYRLCSNLMFDLGMAARYDPRMEGLEPVELYQIKEGPGNFGHPRPLTQKEIETMVDRYFRDISAPNIQGDAKP